VVLSERRCHYLKSAACLVQGVASVTDTQFVWKKSASLQTGIFGFLGKLFGSALSADDFSISLSEIRGAVQTTFGRNKNILAMETTAGQQYRFLVDDVAEWLGVLKKA